MTEKWLLKLVNAEAAGVPEPKPARPVRPRSRGYPAPHQPTLKRVQSFAGRRRGK